MGESPPQLLRMTEQLKRNVELAYNGKDYSGVSTFIKKYNDLLSSSKRNWERGYLERFHPLKDVSIEEFSKLDVPRTKMREIIMATGELANFLRTKI